MGNGFITYYKRDFMQGYLLQSPGYCVEPGVREFPQGRSVLPMR